MLRELPVASGRRSTPLSARAKVGKARGRGRSPSHGRRWWPAALGGLGAVALGVLLWTSQVPSSAPSSLPRGASTLAAAQPASLAPDLALSSASGPFRLSDLRGRPVLLYFSFPG